jgi:hypothetical protein
MIVNLSLKQIMTIVSLADEEHPVIATTLSEQSLSQARVSDLDA